jgi:hypothetical protein
MSRMIFRPVVAGRVQVEPLTVDEYHRMIKTGELPEDTSIELIRGFLTKKDRAARGEDPMTIGHQHALTLQKLMRFAPAIERLGCHLRLQQPVVLPPSSEPEPDGSIIAGDPDDYADRNPGAADAYCFLEVADSSLEYDRSVKMELYAGAGIRQYVIVNLPDLVIELYTQPNKQNEEYRKPQIIRPGEVVTLALGKKSIGIPVNKLLP